jgi:transcriptional regulator with XRE-family HTH domain
MLKETSSFGDWVSHRRRALDITLAELPQRVGSAAITMRKIEQDERRPSLQMAELLADRQQYETLARSHLEAVFKLLERQPLHA